MTSWGSYGYTFDRLNKLQRLTGTTSEHWYFYSADGERIVEREGPVASPTTTTLTIRGLDRKVLRIYTKPSGGSFSWTKDYVYRDGLLLAAVDGSGTKHFHLDHLGTPRWITNASAAKVAEHTYFPFGYEASGTTDWERIKFTGHERDLQGTTAQTDDLDNMHARQYNLNIGRFLSLDPVRGNPAAPQTFNLFAYVANNPVNFTDPLGLQEATFYDTVTVTAPSADGWGRGGSWAYGWGVEWWFFFNGGGSGSVGGGGGEGGGGGGGGGGTGNGATTSRVPNSADQPCPVTSLSINTYLQRKRSPMAGLGNVFVDAGIGNGADPRLIVALAGAETSFGKNITWGQYNAWNYGWNTPQNSSPFESWEHGIAIVTRGIADRYLGGRRRVVDAVQLYNGTYCQGGDCATGLNNLMISLIDQGGEIDSLAYPCGGGR